MKVKTPKGFTLAELLIVMAIIVVLAAVAIPTFGRQLETARETGDMELIRSAYTDALTAAILDASDGTLDGKIDDTNMTAGNFGATTIAQATGWTANTSESVVYTMTLAEATKQTNTAWQYVNNTIAGQTVSDLSALYATKAAFTFTNDSGTVKLNAAVTISA